MILIDSRGILASFDDRDVVNHGLDPHTTSEKVEYHEVKGAIDEKEICK